MFDVTVTNEDPSPYSRLNSKYAIRQTIQVRFEAKARGMPECYGSVMAI